MQVLKAVYDEKLPLFLQKLGLSEKINAGEIKCSRCGETVTLDSFGAIKKTNGHYHVYCNSPKCVAKSIGEDT